MSDSENSFHEKRMSESSDMEKRKDIMVENAKLSI